jgi:glycyl-tRNA synthetase beta chain
VSLSKWIDFTVKTYGSHLSAWNQNHKQKLISFIKNRIIFELQLKVGTREYDLLQGIFASGFDDIANVYQRFEQLSKEINDPSFIRACKVAERTHNITKGMKEQKEINPGLFSEASEKKLFDVFQKEESGIWNLINKGDYSASAKTYGEKFYEPVHQFFDQVMVNADDPNVRANRQALVKKINSLCADKIADLSQIRIF